jgi:hypothetical protein
VVSFNFKGNLVGLLLESGKIDSNKGQIRNNKSHKIDASRASPGFEGQINGATIDNKGSQGKTILFPKKRELLMVDAKTVIKE